MSAASDYQRGDGAQAAADQTANPQAEHIWNDTDPSLPLGNDSTAAGYLEQLLADTAQFDTAPGPATDAWNDTSGVANSLALDDELMSLWMAAPTDFT
jgi:hypothetical protein